LQEGTLQRVGGEEEIRVDVRFIATSKVDLFDAVEEGRFRKDLFYRLRGLEIKLPPLRARGEDLLLLAQHFLRILAADEDSQPKTLSPPAADCMRRHSWPGNVRELRRALESAVAVCSGPEIGPIHLPDYLREQAPETTPFTLHLADKNGVQFNELVHQFEDEIIHWAMAVSGGQQHKAAEILGLPRTTLQSKLSRHRNS
jgi:two-component system NtrC family response regulator